LPDYFLPAISGQQGVPEPAIGHVLACSVACWQQGDDLDLETLRALTKRITKAAIIITQPRLMRIFFMVINICLQKYYNSGLLQKYVAAT
jgi:hypothetical protein